MQMYKVQSYCFCICNIIRSDPTMHYSHLFLKMEIFLLFGFLVSSTELAGACTFSTFKYVHIPWAFFKHRGDRRRTIFNLK